MCMQELQRVRSARGGRELQDRRVQGVTARQGVPHRVRAPQLQRQDLRRPLQALHRPHAPDQGSPPVLRLVNLHHLQGW